MNRSEVHKMFKMAIDKDDASINPSFVPVEIDYWVNTAMDTLIKTKMSGLNTHRKGFEANQKRMDDFRMLLISKYLTPKTTVKEDPFNVNVYGYPEDYLHEVGDTAYIKLNTETGDATQAVDTIEATVENIDSRLRNSLSEVHLHNGTARPIKLRTGNSIWLYRGAGYSVPGYKLYYVKKPTKLDPTEPNQELDSFPDYIWSEIIILAARLALANTSDSRYSAYYQESQLAE